MWNDRDPASAIFVALILLLGAQGAHAQGTPATPANSPPTAHAPSTRRGAPAPQAPVRGGSRSGAAPQAVDTTWAAWRLVLGDWVAEQGGGVPGAATEGGDSFHPALGGRILQRRYWSAYPATARRAAFRDEGLMIVFPEAGGYRAIAFDNEGHVIRYSATASDTVVVFVSDAVADAPRFRLSYRPQPAGRLGIRFELAPSGDPEGFRTYVEGSARRQ